MKKVNLEAKVLEIPTPSTVQTRYGNSAKVTNAWIEDETGKVKLCFGMNKQNFLTSATLCRLRMLQFPHLKVKDNCALEKMEQPLCFKLLVI